MEFRAPVQFYFLEGAGQPRAHPGTAAGAVSCDLGEGGIRMHVNDFIACNKNLAVNFELGPEKNIGITGRVVWAQRIPHSESYHIGVKFEDTPGNRPSRDAVAQFLAKV